MIRHLIKLFSVLFVLSFGQSAWANCTVNGVNYKTNGGSGTAITTAIIKNRASSWNNATDLITTCDVSSITNMTDMFRGNGAINQNLSDWDTSSVTGMRYMFSGASAINSVSFPNTSAVTNMKRMFDGATSLTSVSLPKTGAVTSMENMFYDATSLTSVSLPETGAVTNMGSMLDGATSLTSVSLPETGAVLYMNSMFRDATSIASVSLPKTGAVTDMSYMFRDATSIASVSLPKTGAVTDMSYMFRGATSLTGVSLPKTGSVSNMNSMFLNATALTSFSLQDTSSLTQLDGMFSGATSLTSVSLPDTSSVTSMYAVFRNCTSFNQNIRSWNVDSVTDGFFTTGFQEMFDGATLMLNTYGGQTGFGATPTAAWFTSDSAAPTMSSVSLNTAQDALTVTFSESVYDTTGGSGNLEADDFVLSIAGGTATLGSATPTSITKTSQLVWVLGFSTTGTFDGAETITLVPASSTSIYDAAANAAATSQSNNTANFNDTTAPTVTLTGPSGNVTADFTVTATFSEVVTGLLQAEITVPVSEGIVTGLSGSGAVYTITVSPILGQTVNVSIAANKAQDGAGNLNTASNTLSISAGSPASEFANHKATIKNVITGEMSRALRSSIASDQRMGRKSLTRFIAAQSGSDANQDVAFFVDGNAELKVTQADLVVSTQGGFLSQKTTGDGTWRKLAFGDFDVQTDDKKNVSGFLNGRMAFETNLNSTTMFGYFVGGQVGRSILKGTFEGSQNSFGASIGGYLVQTLAKDVYADLFASLGTNRNSLKLSNGTLDLDSSYSTTSSNIGGSVTGVYAMESFEVWPTLAVTHGVTNVGDVGLTGIAYSLTDTTLSLDAGKVSLTSLSFTPEVRKQVPFQLQEGSSSMATFAPRYTCEQTGNSSSRECGSGAALGVTTASEDGLTNLNAQFQYDKVGSTARRSLQLSFERKF